MKSSAKKVELASVDDLFSTEESRADAQREKVVEIPLSELHPFKGHPFKVKDPPWIKAACKIFLIKFHLMSLFFVSVNKKVIPI